MKIGWSSASQQSGDSTRRASSWFRLFGVIMSELVTRVQGDLLRLASKLGRPEGRPVFTCCPEPQRGAALCRGLLLLVAPGHGPGGGIAPPSTTPAASRLTAAPTPETDISGPNSNELLRRAQYDSPTSSQPRPAWRARARMFGWASADDRWPGGGTSRYDQDRSRAPQPGCQAETDGTPQRIAVGRVPVAGGVRTCHFSLSNRPMEAGRSETGAYDRKKEQRSASEAKNRTPVTQSARR